MRPPVSPGYLDPHDVGRGRDDPMEELEFKGLAYYLDKSGVDVLVLRREDGSPVAYFSAQGATKENIVEAAREDYRARFKAS